MPAHPAVLRRADLSGEITGKDALRRALFARRKAAHAHAATLDPAANARLADEIRARGARIIAGFRPIRTEIDPTAAMTALHEEGFQFCAPVVERPGAPLSFREWAPGCEMAEGAFGAAIPAHGAALEPDTVIAPLLGWDRAGGRLGYGGGFYDRTLERLRARGPLLAIGFAYAAQEAPSAMVERFDQPLDLIVTELETVEIVH